MAFLQDDHECLLKERANAWRAVDHVPDTDTVAADLFNERGANYCNELVELLLTLLEWDRQGRPYPWPWRVKQMRPEQPLDYALEEITPE